MLRVVAAAACVINAAAHGSWPEDFLFIESTAPAGGPEQLWLALGSDPKSVVVSWLTATKDASTVKYGTNGALSLTATGSSTTYSTLGYTSGFIHNATLPALEAGAAYSYQVGGASAGFSATYAFTAPRGVGAVYPFKLAAIGDLGQTANSNSTIYHVAGSGADVAFITGDLSCAFRVPRGAPRLCPPPYNARARRARILRL